MSAWHGDGPEPEPLPGSTALLVLRGLALGVLTFGGLALLLLLRLVERPLFGLRRPITPWITRFVCRSAFRILGIGYATVGAPMEGPGAMVANHGSWLDIFALNACQRVYFVSKAEVRDWPGIGWLARANGTLFIQRDRRQAAAQVRQFEDRLHAGHKLLFFPEGTSSDGRRVLPFKPTLFAAFLSDALRDELRIQPVSVIYEAPAGADPRSYGWWGDMEFGPHLAMVLGVRKQGRVTLVFHDPLEAAAFDNRKELAAACEAAVRSGFVAQVPDAHSTPGSALR